MKLVGNMTDINRHREAPTLFDFEGRTMIGRKSANDNWHVFTWGDKTDLTWEYAPLKDENKHLVNNNKPYSEWNN